MQYIINGGIYDIDLNGTNDAEFIGSHPALILKSIKNSKMYYVIPLTTYTKERWKNYRKYYCCRITTTNSIARIDKLKIMHKSEIENRWIKNDIFLMPTPSELNAVFTKFKEYIDLTTKACIKDYNKYQDNYNLLYKKLYTHFETLNIDLDIKMKFCETNFICTFDMNLVTKLTFDDIKHISYSIIGKDFLYVSYDKNLHIITLVIKNSYKNALTLKEKNDIVNLTKGQYQ